jgi:hypothetical protein
MDALRNTISTQSIKTKQIVFQYPDGSFPEAGAILNVTDARGHTDWTRAPNLDSVTLVDSSGNEGIITYTDVSGLMVNNIPVGGGGGVGSGGTNIDVTGLGVINFDPTKGGGVDMSGAPMTRLQELQFDGSANVLFGAVTGLHYDETTKVLTVNPPPMPAPVLLPPLVQGMVVIGSIKAPLLTTASVSNADVIGYNTATGEFEVQPAGGGGGGLVDSVTAGPSGNITVAPTTGNVVIDLSQNVTLTDGTASLTFQPNLTQARIDLSSGNTTGSVVLSDVVSVSGLYTSATNTSILGQIVTNMDMDTTNAAIRFRIANSGVPSSSQLKLEDLGGVSIVTIGDPTYTTIPNLQFSANNKNSIFNFDHTYGTTGVLNVNSLSNAPIQLNVPLNDLTSTAGIAGQVLTSDGSGNPPYWQPSSAPTAGTNISVSGTQVNFDPSGGVNMLLNDISGAKSISISDGAETALLDISETNLLLSSSTGAGFKIGVPLVDVSSNTAGIAGQVLISDGSDNPPYWGDVSGVTSVGAGSNIAVDNTNPIAPVVRVAISSDLEMNGKKITSSNALNALDIESMVAMNLTTTQQDSAITLETNSGTATLLVSDSVGNGYVYINSTGSGANITQNSAGNIIAKSAIQNTVSSESNVGGENAKVELTTNGTQTLAELRATNLNNNTTAGVVANGNNGTLLLTATNDVSITSGFTNINLTASLGQIYQLGGQRVRTRFVSNAFYDPVVSDYAVCTGDAVGTLKLPLIDDTNVGKQFLILNNSTTSTLDVRAAIGSGQTIYSSTGPATADPRVLAIGNCHTFTAMQVSAVPSVVYGWAMI